MSITTRTLECGMPLVMESIPGVKSVAVQWMLPAGSATDPADREGISAMLCEILFRGCGALDSREHADALDRLGITRGCDTSTFHLRLSYTLLGERLIESLPLLVDMVRRPRMEEEAVEPTRDLALQALEGLKDDPHQRAALLCRERHNPRPLNRSGMGTAAGLGAITRDDLASWWDSRARPAGSILAIAGDLESAKAGNLSGPDAVAATLDRFLKGWHGGADAVKIEPSTTRGTYHHEPDESSQVQILLMHDGPPESSPDSTLERVVAAVLSGGMAARLFVEVREKRGLCYSVSESYSTERDYGRCVGYVGTAPERAQQSLDVLMQELRRINSPEGRITEDELARAMIGIRSGVIFSGESTGARAAAIASDHYKRGKARTLDEILAQYRAITLEDVNRYLARRSLGEVTVVTLGPAALTHGG